MNSRGKPAAAEGPASQSVEPQPQDTCEVSAGGGDAAAVAAAALRAEAGVAAGDSATAAEAYAEALRLSPYDAALLIGRSACYQRLGRLEEALSDAQQAVQSRPRLAAAHAALGAVFRHLGRHGDEVAALRRAVELDTKREMVRCVADRIISIHSCPYADAAPPCRVAASRPGGSCGERLRGPAEPGGIAAGVGLLGHSHGSQCGIRRRRCVDAHRRTAPVGCGVAAASLSWRHGTGAR